MYVYGQSFWPVRGTLNGKYGVLCRRPYYHWPTISKVYMLITSWHRWKSTFQRARTIVLWCHIVQTIIQAREMKQIKGFSSFQQQSNPKMASALTKIWMSFSPVHLLCSKSHNTALGCGNEIRILVNKNSSRAGTNEITGQSPKLCQNSGWCFCLQLAQTGSLKTCTYHIIFLKRKLCVLGVGEWGMVFKYKML